MEERLAQIVQAMTPLDTKTLIRPQNSTAAISGHTDMIWIPGGTFSMGSDRHYADEAPVHRVTVDPFWIDIAPVTNREFRRFVTATGYVTFAEIAPDPNDYPGALPNMLKAGALIFNPPKHAVDTHELKPVVDIQVRRQLEAAVRTAQFDQRAP